MNIISLVLDEKEYDIIVKYNLENIKAKDPQTFDIIEENINNLKQLSSVELDLINKDIKINYLTNLKHILIEWGYTENQDFKINLNSNVIELSHQAKAFLAKNNYLDKHFCIKPLR